MLRARRICVAVNLFELAVGVVTEVVALRSYRIAATNPLLRQDRQPLQVVVLIGILEIVGATDLGLDLS
ncbi:MAG: hypothetical protein QM778_00420 [Myxococcales bacterium]